MRLALGVLLLSLAVPGLAPAQTAERIVRLLPDGPPGVGLTGEDGTRNHTFYRAGEGRYSAGVWEAEPRTAGPMTTRYTEFMYLLEGSVTLVDAAGREETFRAGDALLVPRGTTYTWKQTEPVRKYWAIFERDPAQVTSAASAAPPTFVRLHPGGPPETGLRGEGRTKSHAYYRGTDGSSVGVWETAPHTADGFHETRYAELMVFLSGTVTLRQPGGVEETFGPGEAALVPKGAEYRWSSGTARKFWVIVENEPATSTTRE